MICRYCGCEVEDDSNFCTNCGRKLTAENDVRADALQEMAKKPVKKRGKKRLLIILGAVIFAALVVGVIFLSGANGRKLQKQLDLGQRYLDEPDYEQAAASYMAAIEIDPMCVKAYIGAADAYIGLEDLESAEEILEQGYEVTKDADIEEKLKDVQEEIEKIEREEEKEEEENFGREESSNTSDEEVQNEEKFSEERTVLKKETIYNEDGSVSYIGEYNYDEAGNLMEFTETWHPYDEGSIYKNEYQYNEAGNVEKYTEKNLVNGVVVGVNEVEYEYDEAGMLIMSSTFRDGGFRGWTEYEYDEHGNRIKEISGRADDEPVTVFSHEYKYDSAGRILRCVDRYSYGHYNFEEYDYDEDGNLVEERFGSGDNDGEEVDSWQFYEYDEAGRLIREYSLSSESVYEYDTYGKLIQKIRQYGTGEKGHTEYVYDEDGYLIKEVEYMEETLESEKEYITFK